ncbi:MAG: cation transporter [Ruminococcus sp.]|nr:cation transporter [Ruminococcus sp.]
MFKITLKIDGMMCNMCEAHANQAIREKWNVKKVSSSHKEGKTVIITEQDITNEELAKVIEKTGYKLLDVVREPYEKKGLLSKLK